MKKQNNAKKVNKPLSKKVAPFVMSTTMMAATFLAAGAPISAAELEGKNVNHEVSLNKQKIMDRRYQH